MGTPRQKKTAPDTKPSLDMKALQKHVWNALATVADDASAKLVAAQRSGKITVSDKDMQAIISVIRAAAESAAAGVTKSIATSVK